MSLRPRAGAPNPARGGDGRRRRWSESPIPRVATRRVRSTQLSPTQAAARASQLFGQFATVTPSDDFYFTSLAAVGIESADDSFHEYSHYWGVSEFGTGDPLLPSNIQDEPWRLYWHVSGEPGTDITVTDEDWFLVPLAGGGPCRSTYDVFITDLTLRVANEDHTGELVARNLYGLDYQAFVFPTLPVPFTFEDSLP